MTMAPVALPKPAPPRSFEALYRQIRALPEGLTGEILEPGVLRTMSRPGRLHRWAAQACQRRIGDFDTRNGGAGWWIEAEAEVRLPGGRLVVPDLIGYRVERVPQLPDENPLTLLPDWCCEVLSPSTARDDIALKLPLYASAGVPWIWYIHPEYRLIEVFETVLGRATLTVTAKDDDKLTLPPFDTEFSLAPFWPPAAPEAAVEPAGDKGAGE
jgi:Uma2 family endonuclease